MAERGYREHGRDSDRSYGRRDRESSIFTDENDRWRGQEGGRNEDRGFFDRAGDEVRSWFGDDEAERRRERDARRDEGREGFGGRDNNRGERSFGSERGRYRETWGGGDYSGGQSGGRGRTSERGGSGGFGGARGDLGRNASWDDNYRRWRDQQIEQLDREYDDYCRHRQQQFESDFDTWRNQNRESGGPSQAGERTREASAATTRTTGSEGAGAATAGGGGRSSASTSSTGSTSESNESTNMSGTESGGRGRSRGSS